MLLCSRGLFILELQNATDELDFFKASRNDFPGFDFFFGNRDRVHFPLKIQ